MNTTTHTHCWAVHVSLYTHSKFYIEIAVCSFPGEEAVNILVVSCWLAAIRIAGKDRYTVYKQPGRQIYSYKQSERRLIPVINSWVRAPCSRIRVDLWELQTVWNIVGCLNVLFSQHPFLNLPWNCMISQSGKGKILQFTSCVCGCGCLFCDCILIVRGVQHYVNQCKHNACMHSESEKSSQVLSDNITQTVTAPPGGTGGRSPFGRWLRIHVYILLSALISSLRMQYCRWRGCPNVPSVA